MRCEGGGVPRRTHPDFVTETELLLLLLLDKKERSDRRKLVITVTFLLSLIKTIIYKHFFYYIHLNFNYMIRGPYFVTSPRASKISGLALIYSLKFSPSVRFLSFMMIFFLFHLRNMVGFVWNYICIIYIFIGVNGNEGVCRTFATFQVAPLRNHCSFSSCNL